MLRSHFTMGDDPGNAHAERESAGVVKRDRQPHRSVWCLAFPVLVALVASACSSGSGGASSTVTFTSWGGSYQDGQVKAWIEPYEKETGTRVIQDNPTDYSKLRTMVEAGRVTWDVVSVEADFGLDVDGKWLDPIDYSIVDKSQIQEGMADTYRVGILTYAVALGYNTNSLGGQTPAGWAGFFDPQRFPCKRAAQKKASSGILEIALMADGVKPADMYPIDVDRALRKLDTIKKDLVWFDTGSEGQQLLASGEVCMAALFSGRVYSAKKDDKAPVGIAWSQPVISADYLVVPKGTPHEDASMKLIAYITSAAPQSRLSRYLPYAPANTEATTDPATGPYLTTNHLAGSVRFDDEWWAQNFSAVDERFQAWLLG
jgi:putative spermidine/putrescine transport system substrate-binding protein